jgi:hypothetical protein
MHLITSLAAKLQADYPQFRFVPDTEFRWVPLESSIFYDQASDDVASFLHELSHALLGHTTYIRDIELIELERDAWHYAQHILAQKYVIEVTDDQVEDSLDTYRDWLHARSTCPGCSATGIQVKKNEYKCLACNKKWRVNDARICALRRYKVI